MTDTGYILAIANRRADELSIEDQGQFGRALLYCGAAIVGQAEGADAMRETLQHMAVSAEAAMAEGEQ